MELNIENFKEVGFGVGEFGLLDFGGEEFLSEAFFEDVFFFVIGKNFDGLGDLLEPG